MTSCFTGEIVVDLVQWSHPAFLERLGVWLQLFLINAETRQLLYFPKYRCFVKGMITGNCSKQNAKKRLKVFLFSMRQQNAMLCSQIIWRRKKSQKLLFFKNLSGIPILLYMFLFSSKPEDAILNVSTHLTFRLKFWNFMPVKLKLPSAKNIFIHTHILYARYNCLFFLYRGHSERWYISVNNIKLNLFKVWNLFLKFELIQCNPLLAFCINMKSKWITLRQVLQAEWTHEQMTAHELVCLAIGMMT